MSAAPTSKPKQQAAGFHYYLIAAIFAWAFHAPAWARWLLVGLTIMWVVLSVMLDLQEQAKR